MKKYLVPFVAVIFSSQLASATVYRIKMGLLVQDKIENEMSVVIEEGKTGTISQENNGEVTSIEVTPKKFLSDDGVSTISLDMKLVKVQPDGTKSIESSPKIVTFLDEKAEISQENDSGNNVYKLSVVASEVK